MYHIVLTGVTKGCGRGLLEEFAQMGHTVMGCGRDTKQIEALKKEYPAPHRFDVVDVADAIAVDAWAKRVLEKYPAPDFLINNAGVMNKNAPLWEISSEEFDYVIGVNIRGVANVIRAFVPSMIERKKGVVVNFSSGWGRSVSPNVAPYCATKWAIEGLSKALAEELPREMKSVPFNPGVINTDMLQSCFGHEASHYPSPGQWAKKTAKEILSL